ncbi:cache domain-containing protein [Anaerotignum sp. MB30-C6]|uniref:cache domain-containing protein n=1 Tax=Anaerotignum sp. MB30-C6 TaxID=3070814 RepID=UPI0027DB0737|nr:cache domain-containing protein [Anaerotignum sp. MB30-C6]WMI80118.1 cache domain-containing protein [Anaerotignum sp. MB30-C6]
MKKEKDILNLTTRKMAAMISLLVLIGIAFLLTFNAKMKTEVDKQIGVRLKELTEQAAAQIEIEMGKCVEGVESLAIYLGSTDIKIDKNLEPFLEMVADRTSVTRISVITSDGWVFSSAGFESSPSVYKGAQETLQGKSGITGIFTSSLTGERAISIYRPLVRDGQIIAAICGTVEFKDLEKILSFSGFNGQGYSYIFQRNGDVITWSEHPNMVSLKHNVINFLKGNAVDVSTTLEEFEKRIKNGEPGYLEYKFQGKARKVYYAPIAFEDWYILSIVPEQVIKDRSEELKFYAVELTLKIIAIYIGFYLVALAWSKKNTKHLEEAHYLAVKSNKRYEIAMKHTKCYMLEYDILSDRIISLSKGTNELLGLAPRMSHDKVAKVIFSKLKIESCVVLKDFIRAFGQNDEERDCELELKSNRWIRFSASYVTKFGEKLLIGVVEDITEKKRVEAQYIQEEQIFQAMLSEAIFGFSLDLQEGKVISYFQNGQETKSGSSLSLSTDEMLIENICSYIHPEFREKAIKLFNR